MRYEGKTPLPEKCGECPHFNLKGGDDGKCRGPKKLGFDFTPWVKATDKCRFAWRIELET